MSLADRLAPARRVADAVLYEGYLLYPYRASSPKNQVRWQFGVVGPAGASALQTECLVGGVSPVVHVRLRFLQVQDRTVVDGAGQPVDGLTVGGARWVPFEEAVEREVDVPDLVLADLTAGRSVPVAVPGGTDTEDLTGARGGPRVGRLVRRRSPLAGTVALRATALEPARWRLTVRLENAATQGGPARSFVSSHLVLAAQGGAFLSLTDPPAEAAAAAAGCVHEGWWPVLAGPADDVLLAAPIILPDRPRVAAESPGDLFDLTEIDEILTLRVLTMTPQEQEAARGTDPRAAALLDRCADLGPEELAALHGGRRPETDTDTDTPWWDPAADGAFDAGAEHVIVGGVRVAKGSRVVLRPRRRADAQDLFLAGMTAVVAAVHQDVDGDTHVAVTLADDPAADLHEAYGRYYYFGPEELELAQAAP